MIRDGKIRLLRENGKVLEGNLEEGSIGIESATDSPQASGSPSEWTESCIARKWRTLWHVSVFPLELVAGFPESFPYERIPDIRECYLVKPSKSLVPERFHHTIHHSLVLLSQLKTGLHNVQWVHEAYFHKPWDVCYLGRKVELRGSLMRCDEALPACFA